MVTCTRGACTCSGERRMLDVIFGREVFFRTLLALLAERFFFRTLGRDSLG